MTIGTSQVTQTEAPRPTWGRLADWNSAWPAAWQLARQGVSERLASCALFGGGFRRLFLSAATGKLQAPAQIHPAGIWQVSQVQFRARVQEPTCCYRLIVRQAAQTDAASPVWASAESAWLEFTPPIAHAMISLLLGGSARECPPGDGPLTAVERGLLRRIAQLLAEALAASWPAGPAPAVSLARDEHVPESVALGADDQLLAVLNFFLSVSGQAGAMRLAMAPGLLERLLPDETAAVPSNWKALELSAALPETSLPDEEFTRLAPGDLLVTDTPADSEAVVKLAGIAKFTARLGCWGNRRAVSITGGLAKPPGKQRDPS